MTEPSATSRFHASGVLQGATADCVDRLHARRAADCPAHPGRAVPQAIRG
jgi:hypothetical protein